MDYVKKISGAGTSETEDDATSAGGESPLAEKSAESSAMPSDPEEAKSDGGRKLALGVGWVASAGAAALVAAVIVS